MAAPTKQDVLDHVRATVAGFCRLDPSDVLPRYELRGQELALDDTGLGYIAMSLRGYIRHFNDRATITAAEARAKKTVQELADLAYARITS